MSPPPSLPDHQPVNRTTARNALLLNQFATPGLGSLLAHRWVEGVGQLLVACAGFLMFLGWFVRTLIQYYSLMTGGTPPPPSYKLAVAGTATFLVAWVWSLFTSLSLLREAARPPVPSGPARP